MGKIWKGIAVTIAAACALVLSACGGTTVVTSGEGGQSLNTITVNATAEVKVTPDRASINVGVTTQGATADEAEAANAELMEAVLAALAEQGVAEESIQTSWTNLSPVYGVAAASEAEVEIDDTMTTGAVWPGYGNDIVGYEMTTQLTVSDLTVEQVGDVIQAVVNAGANRVDGVSYYASNFDEAYAEALGQAVESAKPKAETIARAAGVSVGNVVQVTEGYQNRAYAYSEVTYDAVEEADAGGGMAKAIAVAPGTVSIEASVTVTYAIE